MTENITRQPAGVPVGGQFAATAHSESDVSLAAPASGLEVSDDDFGAYIHSLSDGYVSAGRRQLQIEGVEDYWRLSFNNEDDLSLFVVVPSIGEAFSVVDYGIHTVSYSEGLELSIANDGAPERPACVLDTPAEKRGSTDPETLAKGFRQAGHYTDPRWADEDDDTGQVVWKAVHTRLVSDLGVPAV